MGTLETSSDSKISRSFLRMVIKELGKPVPAEIEMNSWELVDLIIKDIHLLQLAVKRAEGNLKNYHKVEEIRKQQTMESINSWYRDLKV